MRRLTIILVLLLLLPISGSNALIFGADRRTVAANGPGSLFGPVGIIYAPDQSAYATAFLIDDCHALTVQHIFGNSFPATGQVSVIAFNVSGPPRSWAVAQAKVIAEGGFETMRGSPNAPSADWTVMKLSKCLGRTYGHVRLTARMPSPADVIGIAGFPGDRPLREGLSLDTGCHIRLRRALTIFHDCSALPGNSGSPMFRIVEAKGTPVLEAFAILQAAHSTDDIGRDIVEARDNYPQDMWNIAIALCGISGMSAPGLRCKG